MLYRDDNERTIGRAYWIRTIWRGGSDDRSYLITIPKRLADKYKMEQFVKIEEHPTEEALIIRKI